MILKFHMAFHIPKRNRISLPANSNQKLVYPGPPYRNIPLTFLRTLSHMTKHFPKNTLNFENLDYFMLAW